MRVSILLVLALGATLAASAQTTNLSAGNRPLSLRECIDLALSRNLDLQIEHLTTDIARYDLTGAYGAYVPTFSFNARHDSLDQPGDFDVRKFNPYQPYELHEDTLGSSLNGLLPWGLSYRFGADAIRRDALTDFNGNTNNAILFPAGIRHTNNSLAEAGVTLQQHLLKDFWMDTSRERLLVRRKDLKISEQALRFQIMKTVLAVALGYYDLISARETIRVEEQALVLKQQFLAETRRRVEVGDLPPLDAEQAETQLQNTLTALAVARENFVSRQIALKNLFTDNFKEWADLEVQPTDALLAVPAEAHRAESFRNAMSNRPDLAEARLAVEKSDVIVQFNLNQLFPNLDLIGGYGDTGIQPDTSSALSDAFHFRNPDYFYGVVVSFPLSNVGERNSYRASKAAKQISALQLKKAEQAVLMQVADWVNRVQSALPQLDSTRKARDYAEAALAAEEKKLQNGFSTTFFILELQEALTVARMAELQARANYNKAQVQLAFAEGTILEKEHLSVEVK